MGDVAAILGVSKKRSGAATSTSTGTGTAPSTSNNTRLPTAPQPPPIKPTHVNNTTIPIPSKVLKILTNGSGDGKGGNGNTSGCGSSSSDPLPLPPIVPTLAPDAVVKVNNKFIHSSKKARPWCWANFSSSARNDGLLLHHWVRAGVEYPEYPFARFNVHMDALNYRDLDTIGDSVGMGIGMEGGLNVNPGADGTGVGGDASSTSPHTDDHHHHHHHHHHLTATANAFYEKCLQDENWTQSETDDLLELCRIYELRWPVIMDRWIGKFGHTSSKKVEDLQHRYYTIGMVLNQRLVEKAARVEAENLAKALAAAGRGSVAAHAHGHHGHGHGHGHRGMMGNNGGGMEGKDNPDGNSRESLMAQHALATAISSSSSKAIDTLGVKGDGSGIVVPPPSAATAASTGAAANKVTGTSSGTGTTTTATTATSTTNQTQTNAMTSAIKANMQPSIASTNTGTSNQAVFDLDMERQRRRTLDKIWQRSKDDEIEEQQLRHELKLVEAQIRKLKKSGGHILAAAGAGTGGRNMIPGSAAAAVAAGVTVGSGVGGAGSQATSVVTSAVQTPASSRGPSPLPPGDYMGGSIAAGVGVGVGVGASAGATSTTATVTNIEASYAMLDAQFASSAPIPTPGIPYLQSGRLKQPKIGGQMGINKTQLKRMEQVLKELNVNERPIPTKRVCDMYDHVRKGVLTLLTLQKIMLKRESEVVNRRLKLEKVAGETVAREIAARAEAAHAAKVAAEKAAAKAAAAESKSKPKGGGGKGGNSGGSKSKASGGGSKSKSTKKKATGEKSGAKRKAPSKKASTVGSSSSANKSATGTAGAGTGTAGNTNTTTTTATTSPITKAPQKGNGDAAEAGTTDGEGAKPKKRARKN